MREIKREDKTSILAIALMLLLCGLIYFFLGVSYDLSFFEKFVMTLASFLAFFFYARRGFSHFSLFALSAGTSFIGLAIAFGSPFQGDTPLHINLILGAWPTFIAAFLFSVLILYLYEKMKSSEKYSILLFVVYMVFWVLIAINAKYYDGWKAENFLVIPFIIVILIISRWFKFSKLSYTCIFLFMVLHVVGSHYTYSEVPLGFWMQNFFNLSRNHYDRIVHLSFGLLWAYPVREIFRRIGNAKGFWSFWIPIELVLALSCIFELIEWAFAVIYGGDLGVAYLGTQGDVWDAQKDMALAGLGSILAMFATAAVIIYYNSKSFFKEFKESFKVKSNQVLGEEAILRFSRKKQ